MYAFLTLEISPYPHVRILAILTHPFVCTYYQNNS